MKKVLALSGFLACLIAVFSSVASTAPYTDQRHWKRKSLTAPISIAVIDQTGDPSWQAAAKQAASRWNAAAPSDVNFTYGGYSATCPTAGVVCIFPNALEHWWYATMFWGFANSKTGLHIAKVTIQVNTYPGFVPADPELRAILMTHEFGHALGLDHTQAGLMYPYVCAGCQSPTPDADAVYWVHQLHNHVG